MLICEWRVSNMIMLQKVSGQFVLSESAVNFKKISTNGSEITFYLLKYV